MNESGPAEPFGSDPYALAHPYAKPFWRAAAEGRLLIPRCDECGRAHWYPRPFCPLCRSAHLRWEAAVGTGTVYAASTLRRAAPPYTVALVTLDEGPTLMTNLVGPGAAKAVIGDRVAARFVATPEGRQVPVFELAEPRG